MTTPAQSPDVVRDHYDRLLASVYAWMVGDFAQAVEKARAELSALGVARAQPNDHAVDLGAGIGIHTLALSELGYRVTAVDNSKALLDELKWRAASALAIEGDLTQLEELALPGASLVLCMGDTLTQLGHEEQVTRMFASIAKLLAPGGRAIFTYRDYSQARSGAARFFLVRGDDMRVMTCCLDYEATRVQVTDIVHERRNGAWSMRASTYVKLRLGRAWVVDELRKVGLSVERDELANGWLRVVARR